VAPPAPAGRFLSTKGEGRRSVRAALPPRQHSRDGTHGMQRRNTGNMCWSLDAKGGWAAAKLKTAKGAVAVALSPPIYPPTYFGGKQNAFSAARYCMPYSAWLDFLGTWPGLLAPARPRPRYSSAARFLCPRNRSTTHINTTTNHGFCRPLYGQILEQTNLQKTDDVSFSPMFRPAACSTLTISMYVSMYLYSRLDYCNCVRHSFFGAATAPNVSSKQHD